MTDPYSTGTLAAGFQSFAYGGFTPAGGNFRYPDFGGDACFLEAAGSRPGSCYCYGDYDDCVGLWSWALVGKAGLFRTKQCCRWKAIQLGDDG